MNYLSTFRFYDRKGRKLSIFALNNKTGITIFIVTCSKKDKFNKKEARIMFEHYLAREGDEHPEISPAVIKIKCNESNSRNAFMDYCNNTYYRMETNNVLFTGNKQVLAIDTLYNTKTGDTILLKNTLRFVKMTPSLSKFVEGQNDIPFNSEDFMNNFWNFMTQAPDENTKEN